MPYLRTEARFWWARLPKACGGDQDEQLVDHLDSLWLPKTRGARRLGSTSFGLTMLCRQMVFRLGYRFPTFVSLSEGLYYTLHAYRALNLPIPP